MNLPKPPDGLKVMSNVQAASVLGEWLMDVARLRGEPALDRVLGPDWPGTKAQRAMLADGHIEKARNEARQCGNELSYQAAKARGEWGV
jgi:hypothetical protein